MLRKIVWLILTCLIGVALVLSACGQAPTTTPPVTTPPTTQPTTAPPTTIPPTPLKEEPKYGGVLVIGKTTESLGFDEGKGTMPWNAHELHLTHEDLFKGDFAQGLAGTGETDFLTSGIPGVEYSTGGVAESFELPDPDTLVFHIRKGMHFALNAASEASRLVNGRELTADDVVATLKRNAESPTSYFFTTFAAAQKPLSISAPDKWTVVVKCPSGMAGALYEGMAELMTMWPAEVLAKYDLKDWRNNVGTGPFILADFVPQSSSTMVRNPNYYDKDPLHPANQLPYLDSVKFLVITDISTVLAGLNTAKVDVVAGGVISWEQARDLKKTNTDLLWAKCLWASPYLIFMRTDKAPYSDIRVRQALNMALDRKAIRDDYYGGEAELLAFPVGPILEQRDMYIPLDQQPQSVRELFEYNPDKAKKLLAEAGYPNGFKTEILCYTTQADFLSLIKAQWAKVGVDLALDIKDYGVWTSMTRAHSYQHMCYMYLSYLSNAHKLYMLRTGLAQNMSIIDDKKCMDTYIAMQANYWDRTKRRQLFKDIVPYTLEQAWMIQPPDPYLYTAWWPWVKNYHGEYSIGYMDLFNFPIYAWLDSDLKARMTGR